MRPRRAVRAFALLAVAAGMATACGSGGVARTHGATAATQPATPTATPSPMPMGTATAMPITPRPQPVAGSQTFPIAALGNSGVGGTVTVSVDGGTADYAVTITGLRPGSTHAVHDHLGGCAAASRSTHLIVLATRTANMAGVISFAVRVPGFDAGSGRIVIVYATSAAAVITGCANL